ncbi:MULTISPECIES: TerC family protein [Paenibacillus]|uniref:TerC family protein n=1 Tax=Paenibacillus TaxID=44249 RepID=UPI000838CF2D|nr:MULTISPECIES: TerC family protein [Paenibacillus]GIP20509.1 membrane protein [Paenibacillus sp. J22TS3]
MELFSAAFFISLINIIFIDLILAGDNAIVIGMAARKLPHSVQKKAILYGTAGAVILRIAATLVVVWLLNIPWLLAVGGLLLIYISYKVLTDEGDHDSVKAQTSLWPAVRTIVIADAAMGLDNVIAVAGASGQHMVLVVIGLLISVPIVVWGSTLFIKLLNLFPWIAYLGAAVLAYTAAHMITTEPKLAAVFVDKPVISFAFIILIVAAVLVIGHWRKKQQRSSGKKPHSDPATHS